MIGFCNDFAVIIQNKRVVVFAAPEPGGGEACAELHTLDGGDAEQGGRQIRCISLSIYGPIFDLTALARLFGCKDELVGEFGIADVDPGLCIAVDAVDNSFQRGVLGIGPNLHPVDFHGG